MESRLRDLNAAQCPYVALDSRQRYDQWDEFPNLGKSKITTHPITHLILNAVFSSGCLLSGLILESDDLLKPESSSTTRASNAESICERFQSYQLETRPRHLSRGYGNVQDDAPHTAGRWRTFTRATLAKAQDVRSLRLMASRARGRDYEHSSESVMRFTTAMREINQLSCLRKLVVESTSCRLKRLLHALERCSSTLQYARMLNVSIESPGRPWLTLFEHLLECSHLETLYLDDLHASGGRTCPMRNPFLADNDPDADTSLLRIEGQSRVSEAVQHNIKSFKMYSSHPSRQQSCSLPPPPRP